MHIPANYEMTIAHWNSETDNHVDLCTHLVESVDVVPSAESFWLARQSFTVSPFFTQLPEQKDLGAKGKLPDPRSTW